MHNNSITGRSAPGQPKRHAHPTSSTHTTPGLNRYSDSTNLFYDEDDKAKLRTDAERSYGIAPRVKGGGSDEEPNGANDNFADVDCGGKRASFLRLQDDLHRNGWYLEWLVPLTFLFLLTEALVIIGEGASAHFHQFSNHRPEWVSDFCLCRV